MVSKNGIDYDYDKYCEERGLVRTSDGTKTTWDEPFIYKDSESDMICSFCNCDNFKLKYGSYCVYGICSECGTVFDFYN